MKKDGRPDHAFGMVMQPGERTDSEIISQEKPKKGIFDSCCDVPGHRKSGRCQSAQTVPTTTPVTSGFQRVCSRVWAYPRQPNSSESGPIMIRNSALGNWVRNNEKSKDSPSRYINRIWQAVAKTTNATQVIYQRHPILTWIVRCHICFKPALPSLHQVNPDRDQRRRKSTKKKKHQ